MKRRVFLGAAPALWLSASAAESARAQSRPQQASFDAATQALGLVELANTFCTSKSSYDDVDHLLELNSPIVAGVGVSDQHPVVSSATRLAIDFAASWYARFDELRMLLVHVQAREGLTVEELNVAMDLFNDRLASKRQFHVTVTDHDRPERWAKVSFVGR